MSQHLRVIIGGFISGLVLFVAMSIFKALRSMETLFVGMFVGLFFAVFCLLISIVSSWLKHGIQQEVVRYVISIFIVGVAFWLLNLWMISDSMTVTITVALGQFPYCFIVASAAGLVTKVSSLN
jgi:vacuolar-type H+-ATPase subunit I/STV1